MFKRIVNYIKSEYIFIIILILIITVGLYRLPYNIYTGGGILDIKDKLVIENEYMEKGSFNMAYVKSVKATIPIYLLSYIFNWERESIDSVKLDENDNAKDMWKREQIYLNEANNSAVISAYKLAGEDIKINKEVLEVIYIDKDSDTSLATGDIVISIDDVKINNYDEIAKILNKHKIGDKIKINYLRDNKEESGYIVVRDLNGEKKAGIYLVKMYEYDVKRKVDIDFSNSEGGPSGGFMLSLAIYNRLIEEDLTKGRKIAGTGTIDPNGKIGAIGGVKYKVIGASSGNADIFFVPEENYEEAINFRDKKGYDLNIVKVNTLTDAIDYLRRN